MPENDKQERRCWAAQGRLSMRNTECLAESDHNIQDDGRRVEEMSQVDRRDEKRSGEVETAGTADDAVR